MDTPTIFEDHAQKIKQVSGEWFEVIEDPEPDVLQFFEETKKRGFDFAISGHMPYEAKIGEGSIYMRYVGS